jgi:hypothetical protein
MHLQFDSLVAVERIIVLTIAIKNIIKICRAAEVCRRLGETVAKVKRYAPARLIRRGSATR